MAAHTVTAAPRASRTANSSRRPPARTTRPRAVPPPPAADSRRLVSLVRGRRPVLTAAENRVEDVGVPGLLNGGGRSSEVITTFRAQLVQPPGRAAYRGMPSLLRQPAGPLTGRREHGQCAGRRGFGVRAGHERMRATQRPNPRPRPHRGRAATSLAVRDTNAPHGPRSAQELHGLGHIERSPSISMSTVNARSWQASMSGRYGILAGGLPVRQRGRVQPVAGEQALDAVLAADHADLPGRGADRPLHLVADADRRQQPAVAVHHPDPGPAGDGVGRRLQPLQDDVHSAGLHRPARVQNRE